ncbi:hypothetical protein CWB85_15310 [Pseudoalteromonas sp. S1727]|uniref:sensor histidine kinase n=1 Tax=Pseudoalteromonas sp. S1727 TaxID=2066514 RepID=UPI001109E599|nr:ATP-binding protein [Pseudoalteromonas sp. S1727]TMN70499.1 hypothetical protein CWB85_15310 [Pseudoalteromonas sp. S1727]
MTQQFLRLYIFITASLIVLVVIFGQLYNYFFEQDTPSIPFTVQNFQQLIANKEQQIAEIPHADLALPQSLHKQLVTEGIITVNNQNNQRVIYLPSERTGFVYRVGPLPQNHHENNNLIVFFAFYILLGSIILILIRPVFRDLSILQTAADQFSQQPVMMQPAIKPNSSIAPLANTFSQMSQRIEQFIHLHRDLSRIISHEIRTPLTRMRFALSLTEDDLINEQIQQDIDEIEQRLDQYLHFARIEHQQQHFEQEKTNIEELIQAEIEKYVLYENLTIVQNSQVKTLCCEANYIAIAVQNLLVNASKYAKKLINISVTEDNTHYYLSVEDDGQGLPVNATSLIDPFQQGENDNLASGYGLGLYIVKRIASWHSGDVIMANSNVTGGAKVTLSWPKQSTL